MSKTATTEDKRHRFLALLALPGAKRLALATGAHRCASFAMSLALTVALVGQLHSLAKAGIGSGIFIFASALGEPWQGRICDRFGARVPLRVFTAVFAFAFAAMVALIVGQAPLVALYPMCALAGASMPFVRGPSRAIWWRIALTDPERITASAFEGTVGPFSYAVGYLVCGLVAAFFGGIAALVCAGGLLLAGAAGICALVGDARPAQPVKRRHFLATLQNGPLLAVLFINFTMFFIHGLLQVFLIARTSGSDASLLLGLVLLASAAYGLVYGARNRKRVPEREQLAAMGAYAVAAVLLALGGPLWLLLVILVIHGATRSPLFVYTYHLSAAYAPAEQRTESVAWNGAAIWLGMAAGKAAGGVIATSAGHAAVMPAGLPLVALSGLAALWLLRRGRGARQRQLTGATAAA